MVEKAAKEAARDGKPGVEKKRVKSGLTGGLGLEMLLSISRGEEAYAKKGAGRMGRQSES